MESKVENILIAAGYNHRYQYNMLVLVMFFWCFNYLMTGSLALLEKPPLVDVNDKLTGSTLSAVPLVYDYCDKEQFDYKIVKTSNHSWTNEFDINCDKKLTGLIGSFAFLGAMIGSFSFQIFSNTLGRKNTVFYFGLLFAIAVATATLAKSIYWLYFFEVVIQFFSYNVTLCSFIQVQESVEPEQRSIFGSIIHSFFSVSAVLFIILYWTTQSWRIVFLIGGVGAFATTLLYYFAAYESPKLLMSNGDIDGFLSVVEKIADTNNKTAQLKGNKDYLSLKNFDDDDTDNEVVAEYKGKQSESTLDRYFSLVYYDSQRYNFLLLCFIWFVTLGSYHALSIYIKNLTGSIYVNGIIIYLAEIIAFFFFGWIADFECIGRKYTFVCAILLSIVSLVPLVFMDSDSFAFLFFSFGAKLGIGGVFNVMLLFSGEVFPTSVRANAVGMNSICGRIASIIFPMMIEYTGQGIFLLFLVFNVIELVLVFRLPETRGKPALLDIPEKIVKKSAI